MRHREVGTVAWLARQHGHGARLVEKLAVEVAVVGDASEAIVPKETFEVSIRNCHARRSSSRWVINRGSPVAVMSLSLSDL